MENNSNQFCAACNKLLPFEIDGGRSYCIQCGRTPEAAHEVAKIARKQNSLISRSERFLHEKLGKDWPFFAVTTLIILGGVFFAPVLTLGAGLKAIGHGLGLLFVLGPVLLGIFIYKRIKKRKSD